MAYSTADVQSFLKLPSAQQQKYASAWTPQQKTDATAAWGTYAAANPGTPAQMPNFAAGGMLAPSPTPTTPSPTPAAGGQRLAAGGQLWNGSMWLPVNDPATIAYKAAHPTAGQPGTPAAPSQPQQLETSLYSQILKQLGTNPDQASITDADLKPQAQAFDLATEQARQDRRTAAAERLNAQGLGQSGALDADVQSGIQDAGQAKAAYNAALVGQKLTERRNQLQQAMSLGAGILTANQQQALQRELAQLDATLRRQGYDVQSQLGNADIALRQLLGTGQLNLGLLQALMQNQQSQDRLGFDIGSFGANMNQNALLAALNG